MIRMVNLYSFPIGLLPIDIFNVIDTKTNLLMEKTIWEAKNYYVYDTGEDTDRYKRVINLLYVEMCETDEEDNLSDFNFKHLGYTPFQRKIWIKK